MTVLFNPTLLIPLLTSKPNNPDPRLRARPIIILLPPHSCQSAPNEPPFYALKARIRAPFIHPKLSKFLPTLWMPKSSPRITIALVPTDSALSRVLTDVTISPCPKEPIYHFPMRTRTNNLSLPERTHFNLPFSNANADTAAKNKLIYLNCRAPHDPLDSSLPWENNSFFSSSWYVYYKPEVRLCPYCH